MRTIVYLLAVASLSMCLAGCGSAESPADQATALCNDARIHLDRATDLIRSSTVEGLSEQDAAAKVISELDQAADFARKALAVEGAGDTTRLNANRLLAEIRFYAGGTLTGVARQAQTRLQDQLPDLAGAVELLSGLQANMSFLDELAKAHAADGQADIARIARQVRDSFQARAAQAADSVKRIQQRLDGLRASIKALDEKAEPVRSRAAELRRRMARTAGAASLDLDAQAAENEQRYAEMEDRITALELQADAAQRELTIAQDVLTSLRQTVEAAAANIDRLATLGSDLVAERAELQQRLQAAGKTAAEKAAATSAAFAQAAEGYRKALAAYDDAAAKVAAAAGASTKLAGEARRLKNENPSSPVQKILGDMSRRDAGADLLARQGDMNLRMAEVRRELLDNAARIAPLFDAAGSQTQLLSDAQAVAEQAAAGYTAAAEAYEKATEKLSEAQRWTLEVLRAQALVGNYRLSVLTGRPDRQLLAQAASILQPIVAENRDNPRYFEAVRLAQVIQFTMAGSQQQQ